MRRLAEIKAELAAWVAEVDPACVSAADAARLVDEATAIVNLGQAAQMALGKRVADSASWRHQGHRSPADWLASRAKVSGGEAAAMLATADKLEACPKVADQVRAGRLSAGQTRALTGAVAADPTAEDALLAVAERDGVHKLKERCRAAEHAASDEQARYGRVHQRRQLRHGTDHDGAFRLDATLTADAGAQVLGALAPFERAEFARARLEGRHEPHQAYAADALVALAQASLTTDDGPDRCESDELDGAGQGASDPSSPSVSSTRKGSRVVTRKPSFTVLVDATALQRGWAEPGETCEIPGVGSVPVSRLIELGPDAVWHALVTDGVDVQAYASLTRHIPTFLRVALEATDRECAIAGCNVSVGLEIDHTHDHAKGGPTAWHNLRRFCHFHHLLKTLGWTLSGGHDQLRLIPPDGQPP